MQAHGATHPGKVRPGNEDRFLVRPMGSGRMLVALADGMGGAAGGAVAAQATVDALARVTLAQDHPCRDLTRLARDVSRHLCEQAEADPDLTGMGTTLTAAYVDGHTAHWVHAGDTRLYLLRDATLRQVTRDHTFLQTFLEDGEMTPAQAAEHPLRHMLDQALGTPGCEPDTGALDLAPGDVLLLTTDGVHTELNHDRLADLLATCRDPEYAAVAIVCAVLAGEAKDNVTALVLRVD